jgi:hypothetical protein
MPMITVASIETGPKKSKVFTTNGSRLGCFNDKLAKWGIEQGASYNVETVDNDFGTNIVSAKRVTIGMAAALPTLQTPANTGVSASISAFRTPEQMFVSEVLTAYITNGRCEPQKLTETINFIRSAWDRTFGGHSVHPHMEAAE